MKVAAILATALCLGLTLWPRSEERRAELAAHVQEKARLSLETNCKMPGDGCFAAFDVIRAK